MARCRGSATRSSASSRAEKNSVTATTARTGSSIACSRAASLSSAASTGSRSWVLRSRHGGGVARAHLIVDTPMHVRRRAGQRAVPAHTCGRRPVEDPCRCPSPWVACLRDGVPRQPSRPAQEVGRAVPGRNEQGHGRERRARNDARRGPQLRHAQLPGHGAELDVDYGEGGGHESTVATGTDGTCRDEAEALCLWMTRAHSRPVLPR
jgi:hypothetical protein